MESPNIIWYNNNMTQGEARTKARHYREGGSVNRVDPKFFRDGTMGIEFPESFLKSPHFELCSSLLILFL